MVPKLKVRTQGPVGRWVDKKLEGVMRYVSGSPHEAPQRTHRWNNHHLSEKDVEHLNKDWMVAHQGDQSARRLPQIPVLEGVLKHVTRCVGWKHYVVLEPTAQDDWWHIGWRWSGGVGVSRVPVRGPVKTIVGSGPVECFGIDAKTNEQIPIKQVGEGRIGEDSEFSQVPLF